MAIPLTITVPNVQAKIKAIAAAKHQGKTFQVTDGRYNVSTDNKFKAITLKKHRRKEGVLLEKGKAQRLAEEKIKKDTLVIWRGADNVAGGDN